MPFFSYLDIQYILPDIAVRPEKHFARIEHAIIVNSCDRSPLLALLLQYLPPYRFQKYYQRTEVWLREQLAQDPLLQNVHDTRLWAPRRRLEDWLDQETKSLVLPERFDTAEAEQALSDLWQQLTIIFTEYQTTHEDSDNVKEDRRRFINYLCNNYKQGAQGARTLLRILHYCANQKTSETQKNAYKTLCDSLEEARTAYRGSEQKFITSQDWSCMPGVLERILDGYIPWMHTSETEQAPGAQELKHAFFPFITKTGEICLPSPLLYALFVQTFAAYHGWFVTQEKPRRYQLMLDEKQKNNCIEKMLQTRKDKRQAYCLLLKKILEHQLSKKTKAQQDDDNATLKTVLEHNAIIQEDELLSGLEPIKDVTLWLRTIKQRLNTRAPGGDILDNHSKIIEDTDEVTTNIKIEIRVELENFLERIYLSKNQAHQAYHQHQQYYPALSTEQPIVFCIQKHTSLNFKKIANNSPVNSQEVDGALSHMSAFNRMVQAHQEILFSQEQLVMMDAIAPFDALDEKISAREACQYLNDKKTLEACIHHKNQLLMLARQHQARTPENFYEYYAYDTEILEKIIHAVENEIKSEGHDASQSLPCQDTVLAKAIQYSKNKIFNAYESQEKNNINISHKIFQWLINQGYVHSIISFTARIKAFFKTKRNHDALKLITKYPELHRKILLFFMLMIKKEEALQTEKNFNNLLDLERNQSDLLISINFLKKNNITLTQTHLDLLFTAEKKLHSIAHGLEILENYSIITSNNVMIFISAYEYSENIVNIFLHLIEKWRVALTQSHFDGLIQTKEHLGFMIYTLHMLFEHRLTTPENALEVINANAHSKNLAETLQYLVNEWHMPLDQSLFDALVQAKKHLSNIIYALHILRKHGLTEQENARALIIISAQNTCLADTFKYLLEAWDLPLEQAHITALIEARSHLDAIVCGIHLLIQHRLATKENTLVLIKTNAQANNIIKIIDYLFKEWHLRLNQGRFKLIIQAKENLDAVLRGLRVLHAYGLDKPENAFALIAANHHSKNISEALLCISQQRGVQLNQMHFNHLLTAQHNLTTVVKALRILPSFFASTENIEALIQAKDQAEKNLIRASRIYQKEKKSSDIIDTVPVLLLFFLLGAIFLRPSPLIIILGYLLIIGLSSSQYCITTMRLTRTTKLLPFLLNPNLSSHRKLRPCQILGIHSAASGLSGYAAYIKSYLMVFNKEQINDFYEGYAHAVLKNTQQDRLSRNEVSRIPL